MTRFVGISSLVRLGKYLDEKRKRSFMVKAVDDEQKVLVMKQ